MLCESWMLSSSSLFCLEAAFFQWIKDHLLLYPFQFCDLLPEKQELNKKINTLKKDEDDNQI